MSHIVTINNIILLSALGFIIFSSFFILYAKKLIKYAFLKHTLLFNIII